MSGDVPILSVGGGAVSVDGVLDETGLVCEVWTTVADRIVWEVLLEVGGVTHSLSATEPLLVAEGSRWSPAIVPNHEAWAGPE